jgi:hypothetical protein
VAASKAITRIEFENGGRTFVCSAASSPATPNVNWWWVTISGESQRYAAFRTEPGDTEAKVMPKVIAYYEQLLVDRARPREIKTGWGRPPGKKVDPAVEKE